jgi:hypothetical protein
VKTSKPVSAIQDDSQSEVKDDEEVKDEALAFQNRQSNRFQNWNRNQSQGSGQRSNRYNSGNGNNRIRNVLLLLQNTEPHSGRMPEEN